MSPSAGDSETAKLSQPTHHSGFPVAISRSFSGLKRQHTFTPVPSLLEGGKGGGNGAPAGEDAVNAGDRSASGVAGAIPAAELGDGGTSAQFCIKITLTAY